MGKFSQKLDAFELLKRAIVNDNGFDAALIKLDLSELKEPSPTLTDYVHTTIVHFLNERLAEDDAILPTGEGVAVIFGDAERRDLGASREQLHSSVNTFLAGDPRLQGLRANTRAFRLEKHAPAPVIAAPSSSQEAHVSFAPVWSVAHEMISTYFATAYHRARGGVHYGYSENYRILGVHDDSNYLDLDLEILRRALETLKRSHEAGLRFVIGYSVHSTTLQDETRRTAYMEAMNSAPQHLRRHLTAKIAEIECSVPRTAITHWVSLLRQASSRVSLEFSPNERRFDGLAATGAWAAGFLMPAYPSPSERMHVDQHGLIARWRQGLNRQEMRLFVDDVLTADAFDLVCTEKVDFITSCVLWPGSPQPQGMLRASRASARAAFGDPRAAMTTGSLQQA